MSERTCRPGIPWRKSLERHLENPEVRAGYKALEEEYALIRQLIDLRVECGLSQRQLAKRAGMQQPVIARLEAGKTASLRTLKRVADALDADVLSLSFPVMLHQPGRAGGARDPTLSFDRVTATGNRLRRLT